jgi:hypothetical protein
MRNVRRFLGSALLTAGLIALVVPVGLAEREQGRRNDGNGQPPVAARQDENNGKRGFTAKQMENLETRIATANAIIRRLEPQAKAAGSAGGWRQSTLESLYSLPLARLQQVERDSATLASLAESLIETADDPNLLGDPNADLVYTPIAPCRYVDTRFQPGGPVKVSPGAPRSFDLVNTGAPYGGSGACSLQQNVVAAAALNITITEPNGAPGFLAVKPTLAAPITSWMNWYEAGVNVQLANAGVATFDQSTADPEFVIVVSETTHVIVDFFGYFAEPEATALQRTTTTTGSLNIGAGGSGTVQSGACPANYTLTGGNCFANSYGADLVGSRQATTTTWWCDYNNPTGGVINVQSTGICARVPGR